MATKPKQSIGIDQLLTMAVNGLDQYFFKAHKEKARKLYKEIAGGDVADFVSITFKDSAVQPVKLKLSLDHSEYKGHITFHMFKEALQLMLRNIATKIEKKEDLNVMTSQENSEMIVHVPGVIQDRDNVNVLVLGLVPSKSSATIKLQFLDSDQFKKKPETDDESAKANADESADENKDA